MCIRDRLLRVSVAVAQGLIAALQVGGAQVELLVSLYLPRLGLAELFATLAKLTLHLTSNPVDLFLRLEARFLEGGLHLALGVLEQPIRLTLGVGQLGRGQMAADQVADGTADQQSYYDIHGYHHRFPS